MVKFYLKKYVFNIASTMPFMIGALLLFEEIGYLATIGVCLIGLSAATFGYYGEQFNSNAIKHYKKAKDEKNEKDK